MFCANYCILWVGFGQECGVEANEICSQCKLVSSMFHANLDVVLGTVLILPRIETRTWSATCCAYDPPMSSHQIIQIQGIANK